MVNAIKNYGSNPCDYIHPLSDLLVSVLRESETNEPRSIDFSEFITLATPFSKAYIS